MSVPEFMPTLSKGAHSSPEDGACVMEMVSFLSGENWSDSPACTHPVLAAAARHVNDGLSDADRHLLVPLIGRLFGTAEVGNELDRKRLSVGLAVWSVRSVLRLVAAKDRAVCVAAVEAADNWWVDPCEANRQAANAAANAPPTPPEPPTPPPVSAS